MQEIIKLNKNRFCVITKSVLFVLTASIFISAINAIDSHVTSLMRRYTIRLVETVLATCNLANVAVGRR